MTYSSKWLIQTDWGSEFHYYRSMHNLSENTECYLLELLAYNNFERLTQYYGLCKFQQFNCVNSTTKELSKSPYIELNMYNVQLQYMYVQLAGYIIVNYTTPGMLHAVSNIAYDYYYYCFSIQWVTGGNSVQLTRDNSAWITGGNDK